MLERTFDICQVFNYIAILLISHVYIKFSFDAIKYELNVFDNFVHML